MCLCAQRLFRCVMLRADVFPPADVASHPRMFPRLETYSKRLRLHSRKKKRWENSASAGKLGRGSIARGRSTIEFSQVSARAMKSIGFSNTRARRKYPIGTRNISAPLFLRLYSLHERNERGRRVLPKGLNTCPAGAECWGRGYTFEVAVCFHPPQYSATCAPWCGFAFPAPIAPGQQNLGYT